MIEVVILIVLPSSLLLGAAIGHMYALYSEAYRDREAINRIKELDSRSKQ